MWLGLYYNSLQPSVADFGAEHDFSTGNFRSFSIENGPLDYYALLGASSISNKTASGPAPKPRLRDIVSQFAALVTPFSPASKQLAGPLASSAPRNFMPNWQASPTLPRLTQFGYLASSMTLAELDNAQAAVEEYIVETRNHGFPVDGMHLSSGYCLDEKTRERMYFVWNKTLYPDPPALGAKLEKDLQCHLIINVKPWLLEGHPWYKDAAMAGTFVKAAKDAIEAKDADKCGMNDSSRSFHWSTSMGQTAKGSHFDFSSSAASDFWKKMIKDGVSANGITGLWIDNNEFSTLIDDGERITGEISMWTTPEVIASTQQKPASSQEQLWADQIADRMGWRGGEIEIGSVGRAVLTMGMAKASWEQMTANDSATRPVVVTRSAVPGMQAYAHGTWSGDNSTSWKCLKYNTKMTLSMGLSFGPGLYGHDIGGFAGAHSPSPELLVRWCQQSVWHSRFTLHSWKAISTTFYMYKDNKEVMDALLSVVQLRYQLVPTLYSLYVAHYHRHGWPVLRPLLWNHSSVRACLGQDEQFLMGDTVLAAPALDFGAREVTFTLPHLLDSEDGGKPTVCWWYDVHGKRWIKPQSEQSDSQVVTVAAPLHQCPTLVRENGILVLAGESKTSVFDEKTRTERTIKLFPSPADRQGEAVSTTFALIEDDGISNEASAGAFTELDLTCSTSASGVYFKVDPVNTGFKGQWNWLVELPEGDERKITLEAPGSIINAEAQASNQLRMTVTVN